MGIHKNKIKESIHCCFLCGHIFTNNNEKIIHRINRKKNNRPFNVIIVCPECKKKLLKGLIHKRDIDFCILNRYFAELTMDNREVVVAKVYKYLVLRD